MASEYEVIKIVKPTKLELDRIKKDMGLPSYSQVITTLVEHQKAREELKQELLEYLIQESSKVFGTYFYQLLFNLAKQIPKPMSEITLNDLSEVMQKKLVPP
jgi:hypothetical protein